jgi:eukaryotic-like serine/threonine-protein kinase
VNDAARALIGRTLGGRFRLTSFIGEGAMAAVFRGVQQGEPREVAVKVMHRGLVSDHAFVRRFQREARAAARIEHRNTVRILEHGCDRDVVYIAMELVSGQDLFEVLTHERRLSQARAGRIVVQVCAALEAAHRRGVVHRDLKPENVMLVRDPDEPGADLVKVLDFGIAKLLERERTPGDAPPSRTESAITLVGTVVGTPEYMSPEQARGVPPVDARSDVYACGVLLYQLVTGKLPFRGDSPIEVILQHIERVPERPSAIEPSLHPGLERIILKALAKWPAERQESAQRLADEITAILPELSPTSSAPAGPRSKQWSDPTVDDTLPTVRLVRPEPEARPLLRERASQRPVAPWAPSPWASPPAPAGAELSPINPVEAWVARWWAVVIAVAFVCAAIWLLRSTP